MTSRRKITTYLWSADNAEEAAAHAFFRDGLSHRVHYRWRLRVGDATYLVRLSRTAA
jgi:hypothetical protein